MLDLDHHPPLTFLRGDGGCGYAPPTLHRSGNPYTWLIPIRDVAALSVLPMDWIPELAETPSHTYRGEVIEVPGYERYDTTVAAAGASQPTTKRDCELVSERCRLYVRAMTGEKVVSSGDRSHYALKAATIIYRGFWLQGEVGRAYGDRLYSWFCRKFTAPILSDADASRVRSCAMRYSRYPWGYLLARGV